MEASRLAEALSGLAVLAAHIDIDDTSMAVTDVLERTLLDTFGVAIAGVRTPELRALIDSWPLPAGESTIWGRVERVDSQTAALLVGTALCSLELDEGNKAARGHPGAHVIPAAIAEAERLDAPVDRLLSAILAGYEVATRVATAFSPASGLHPHGHWGALGAAVAVGRLHEFSETRLGQAMDAAAGLALATPFSSALDGSFVRNTWVGAAGSHGITAVRLVAAGLGSNETTARSTFGQLLGSLDPDAILRGLDEPWTITRSYTKRHSSCAYTHPPADAAIELRRRLPGLQLSDIASIQVATHALAEPLRSVTPQTRLAAMFSIPHVVAVALRDGECLPAAFGAEGRADAELARLRQVTSVRVDPAIDAKRPAHRGARVVIELATGAHHEASVPDAVGDADYLPLSRADIEAKLEGIIGVEKTSTLSALVSDLRRSTHTRSALARLSECAN